VGSYELIPYTVTVHVKGDPKELRPLHDFDLAGANIREMWASALAAHAGRRLVNPKNATSGLRILDVRVGQTTVLAVAKPGVSGTVGELEKATGGVVPKDYADFDWTDLRALLIYGNGSSQAVLLLERVGKIGVKTNLTLLMQDVFRRRWPNLVLEIRPTMDSESVKELVAKAPIKSIGFHRSMPTDRAGKTLMVGSPVVSMEIWLKPPRRVNFSRNGLIGQNLSTDSALGVLSEAWGLPVDDLKEQGWEPRVTVKTPSRRERRVSISKTDMMTLTFPLGGQDGGQPELPDFLTTCDDALTELVDANDGSAFGITASDAKLGICSEERQEAQAGRGWKAEWGVDLKPNHEPDAAAAS